MFTVETDSPGGGVFIAVSNEFLSTQQLELETEGEMTWVTCRQGLEGSVHLLIL